MKLREQLIIIGLAYLLGIGSMALIFSLCASKPQDLPPIRIVQPDMQLYRWVRDSLPLKYPLAYRQPSGEIIYVDSGTPIWLYPQQLHSAEIKGLIFVNDSALVLKNFARVFYRGLLDSLIIGSIADTFLIEQPPAKSSLPPFDVGIYAGAALIYSKQDDIQIEPQALLLLRWHKLLMLGSAAFAPMRDAEQRLIYKPKFQAAFYYRLL